MVKKSFLVSVLVLIITSCNNFGLLEKEENKEITINGVSSRVVLFEGIEVSDLDFEGSSIDESTFSDVAARSINDEYSSLNIDDIVGIVSKIEESLALT